MKASRAASPSRSRGRNCWRRLANRCIGYASPFACMPARRRIRAMIKTHAVVAEEQQFFPSAVSPGPAQKRLALVVVLGLVVVFVAITAGLLSGVSTHRVAAFLLAYLAAMFVCDSITAILLFAQF